MSDFNVRSDSVDVEQIMRQIRARIREKRGADYTEAEVKQLADVKLEQFLDPRGLRSDLVEQFRLHRTVSPEPPKYEFEDTTLYDTHRGLLRAMRKLLHPILKLFINPNPLIQALHTQKQINDEFHKRFRQREEMEPLYYEVIHNLVIETTRLGIEVHNLKMRVESLSSRMDFDERRGRALESVVQYKPAPPRAPRPPAPAPQSPTGSFAPPSQAASASHATPTMPPAASASSASPSSQAISGPSAPGAGGTNVSSDTQGGERRRRRRRRRRRPGQTMADRTPGAASAGNPGERPAGGSDEGDADGGFEGDGREDPGDPDQGASEE